MADETDTIGVIAEELALTIEPLISALSTPEALRDFLEELGWGFASAPAALDSLKAPAEQANNFIQNSGDSLDNSQVNELMGLIRVAFDAISKLKSASGLATEFKDEFPLQLVEYLIVEYLLDYQPSVGFLLLALGIIRLDEVPAQGSRLAYQRRVFAFKDFGDIFNDPLVFFKNAYQWGTSDFTGVKLLTNFHGLLTAWGFDAYEESMKEDTVDQLSIGALQPDDAFDTALQIIFMEDSLDVARLSTGVGLFVLPETAADKPGFALLPFASGTISETLELTESLELGFEGGLDLTGGLGLLVRPDKDIEFQIGFGAGTPSGVGGNLGVLLRLANAEEPLTLVGSSTASRLEVAGVSTKGGTRFHSGGKFEVFTEFALEKGKIVIKPDPEQVDGFLNDVMPADGMKIEFDLSVGFSTTQGLYFGGSGGVEVQIPAHIQLGPIEIQSALIAIKPKAAEGDQPLSVPLELAATFKGDFGVLKGVVENVGLKVDFQFPEEADGNLGPLDLSLGFRPPNGVGLSINAGVVTGGGYLYFDFDKEEYAGVLELDINGIISVKAIGLISTKMPDGSKGFSLLVIMTAEFGTPIQLGFGFTLSGVGGLLGLNRTMLLQPIAEGVRSGAINSIMFPSNVVANAPRIISDLRSFFPTAEGIFLIGPMAKLGWGTPNLITLSLGVIIEIPGNIAIVGVLKVVLPDEDAGLLVLQVNFIGAIEFDKEQAWFFASMYESRVLFMTLEGEMGVLVAWGQDANFVVSVGGFHPAFNPPPLPFPNPKRIALNILNTSFAKIRVEAYFAVTSNTVQFGAAAQLYFGVSAFNIDGHIAFDALFQFSPFYFIISISASLSVKVFGIGLFSVRMRGSLEGPTPWHVEGTGSISLLFWDIDVDFSHTWGEEEDTSLPPIAVMPLLKAEYVKLENWTAIVPASNSLLVSLREIESSSDLILHPVGTLKISQRAVPLELTLDKVGAQKPNDANHFTLSVSAGTIEKKDDIEESFATAQFKDMDDSKKLSSPSFEPQTGGVELSSSGEQLNSDLAVKRVVRYEQIIIDTNFRRYVRHFFNFFGSLFTLFLNGNAAAKSELSFHVKKQKAPIAEKIEIKPDSYAVAFNDNNTVFGDQALAFSSQAKAEDFMQQQIANDRNLVDSLHVIPQVELQRAA